MSAFFLTFLSVLLAMVAGREAVRVARLAAAGSGDGRSSLIAVAAICAVAGCAVAAWLAGSLADWLTPRQRGWLVAGALLLAALEVALLDPPARPSQPTRSLGAIALVLFAGVLTDAGGLLVLSLAVATGASALAATGGALAAAGVLSFAAFAGPDWERLPRRAMRIGVALLLAAGAAVIAFAPPSALV